MPYVERNEAGEIVGIFGAPQPGIPEEWVEHAEFSTPPVVSLTRRQFFLQLEIAGLTAQVEQWINAQDALVKIAFRESGSFKRDEAAMQQGFLALGFSEQQVEAFFAAGAQL